MSQTDVDLFRAVRIEQFPNGTVIDGTPAPEVLYPDFKPRPLPDGGSRDADIDSFPGTDGTMWVKHRGGTSLFDRSKVFPGKKWLSFEIPAGTVIPESLIIRFTGYNSRYQANHYQIEPKSKTMQMDAYKAALDNLARNAIVRAVELGHAKNKP